MVIVRFAPSPTGQLHIGGARTALFNWLFAKHHGGKFYLRIEDTDRERSTKEAVEIIFKSLEWLGIDHDGDPVFQFERASRHAQVAHELVKTGKAYYCYCSQQELESMREEAKAKGETPKYNGFWRDRDPALAPKDVKPVVRLKTPQTGETVIQDLVQGVVKVDNKHLDDMVLLRSDNTPTYMLSVVVDDHDMGITHIIRGDDHLNNAFRQYHLYKACGWDIPEFAHIPLIHGPDGAKMSKRHGATGTDAYKEMGILPQAMRNYLLRLGWGHGDDEIISTEQAIDWFGLDHVGKSPSRFDINKLYHLNAHYLKSEENMTLWQLLQPFFNMLNLHPTQDQKDAIFKGMQGLKDRSKTLHDLAVGAEIYIHVPVLDEKSRAQVTPETHVWVDRFCDVLKTQSSNLTAEHVEKIMRDLVALHDAKLGALAMALRIAITGRTVSPNLFEVISILGPQETLNRLEQFKKNN